MGLGPGGKVVQIEHLEVDSAWCLALDALGKIHASDAYRIGYAVFCTLHTCPRNMHMAIIWPEHLGGDAWPALA